MKRIYTTLKESGLDVYFSGQHKGLCKTPYVVVKESNQSPELGTRVIGRRIVDIMIYIPIGSYIAIESYREKVKRALLNSSFLRYTGFETPIIIEEDIKAYSTSFEYEIMKELI